MKILFIIKRIAFALAAYTLTGWSMEGQTKICLSNESPLEGIVYYWEDLKRKRKKQVKGDSTNHLDCRIGEGDPMLMSNSSMMKMIEQVQLSITPLKLTCSGNLENSGVSVNFNGLDDTEPGYNIVDCDNFRVFSDLGIIVGDGKSWVEKYNASYDQKLLSANQKVLDLESQLEDAKNVRLDDKNEIQSLIRENQMLLHKISNLTGIAYNTNNSLRALQSELFSAKDHHKIIIDEKNKLSEENKRMREKLSMIEKSNTSKSNVSSVSSILKTAVLLTTTIPFLDIVELADASTHVALQNPYIHVKNRIGGGLYRFDSEDDATCKGLTYGLACAGFDYMIRPDKYPFFNSYVMHLTPLEAYAEGIVEKEGDSCEMGKSKDPKCLEGRQFIKASCPQGVNGVYYLNDKGKLSHSRCKEDEYEITEDCAFCRKMKKKGSKGVMKTSVSIQDAFCQKDAEEYSGPKITVQGICEIGTTVYKLCSNHAQHYENIPFVIFKNGGKIYLERLITKNLELIADVSFICYEHKGQDGTETETRELKRVKVGDCKNVNSSKSKHCTGDHVFCQKYGCSGSYPEVKCITAPGSGPVLVNILGSWVKPKCLGYEKVLVKREVKRSFVVPQAECETCISSCEDDGIRVTSTGFKITSAVSCSHGSCVSTHQDPSTTIVVPYPGLSIASGGLIGVQLSHNDDSTSLHLVVNCPPRDVCETLHCFFCIRGIINYQCHTILSSLLLSSILSMMIYFLLFSIGKMLYFFKVIPKRLRSPFMWIFMLLCWLIQLVKKGLRSMSLRINNSIGWTNHAELQEVINHRPIAQRRPIPRFQATMFILFSIFSLGLSCSETTLSNSKQTKCVQSGGNVKCTISATITMKAGIIGGESCFIIKGPMDNQQKTVRIKTVSSEIVCREGNSFWTSHYTPYCLSSRRCHLVGDCTGNRCQSWTDDLVSTEFKNSNDNLQMNENKCFEQCGAIGCGCFNINPSCLFVHTVLKSVKPEAIRVFSCVDWVHRLTLLITGPDGEKEKVILSSMGTKFLSWGTVSLTLDAETISGTNSYSFLESSRGGFAIYDEAFSEVPREGFLGEIRCSSESAAVTAHSSCIRAPNLIKYKPMTDIIECTASLIDPFAAFVKGSLPQVRNGMTYTSSMDKKTVQAFNSGSIRALLTITMDDHEIEFLSNAEKCDATFINITGCYSCNYGARVCVRIKAQGNSNFLAVNEKESFYMSIGAWTGTRDYCQVMHFSTPEVDITTQYSCGGESRPLRVKGLLISLGVSDLRNNTGGSSVVVNPSETRWNLSGWLSGLTSWLGGTWAAVMKIILFLFFGFLMLIVLLLFLRSLGMSLFKKIKLT
ncbi:polyprotein [Alenquer virus]|uniref:Envelopment polyprotein n=1 Tax=Alenquer virus TaxID=629726 RepID=F2W3P3_9VIRU|nr:polyprotein [Alenquer virus]AEA30042.1 polyprotein [Alenquer virus]